MRVLCFGFENLLQFSLIIFSGISNSLPYLTIMHNYDDELMKTCIHVYQSVTDTLQQWFVFICCYKTMKVSVNKKRSKFKLFSPFPLDDSPCWQTLLRGWIWRIDKKKLTRIHHIGHKSLVAWSDLCDNLDLTLQLCQVGFIRSRLTYVERSIRRTKSSLYIFYIYPKDIKIFTHFKLKIAFVIWTF